MNKRPHNTGPGCLCVIRQLTKSGPDRARRHRGIELASQSGLSGTDGVPLCYETANQVRPWPPQAASWFGTRVTVGRTNIVLKTSHFKTICPTFACTKPLTFASLFLSSSKQQLLINHSMHSWGMQVRDTSPHVCPQPSMEEAGEDPIGLRVHRFA